MVFAMQCKYAEPSNGNFSYTATDILPISHQHFTVRGYMTNKNKNQIICTKLNRIH